MWACGGLGQAPYCFGMIFPSVGVRTQAATGDDCGGANTLCYNAGPIQSAFYLQYQASASLPNPGTYPQIVLTVGSGGPASFSVSPTGSGVNIVGVTSTSVTIEIDCTATSRIAQGFPGPVVDIVASNSAGSATLPSGLINACYWDVNSPAGG